jgi:hypothetical protein
LTQQKSVTTATTKMATAATLLVTSKFAVMQLFKAAKLATTAIPKLAMAVVQPAKLKLVFQKLSEFPFFRIVK